MAHETPDDELELLRSWQSGSDRPGEILFDRYFKAIKRFFLTKCDTGVEDLVQETFLAVQKGRDRIKTTSFRNYLFGTAHNILRAHLRRKHHDQFDSKQMSIADLNPGMISIIAATDQHRVLELALQRVPLDYQVVLELRFWEGMTAPEMVEVLQIPEGTVRTRLRRALILLEKTIAEIEASPELLEMTLRDFSKWKDEIREMVGLDEDEDEDAAND